MGISKEEMEKAEKSGRVKNSIDKIRWKSLIEELLRGENKFLTAAEIRGKLKANRHVYMQLNYLKKSGFLQTKFVSHKDKDDVTRNALYYGLAEWSE